MHPLFIRVILFAGHSVEKFQIKSDIIIAKWMDVSEFFDRDVIQITQLKETGNRSQKFWV